MTVDDFIVAKGGNAAVAAATGYSAGAVALWRHRKKLPRTAWPEILEAYPDVSLADLRAIEGDEEPGRQSSDEAA
jgi:hypothetical protein